MKIGVYIIVYEQLPLKEIALYMCKFDHNSTGCDITWWLKFSEYYMKIGVYSL